MNKQINSIPSITGANPAGGAPGARPPPKIGKNMIFWRKIVIFHTIIQYFFSLTGKKSLKIPKGYSESLKKNRQRNGQKKRDKRTNNDLQNICIKQNVWAH